MLQPYKIDLYVYADNAEEAQQLEQALKDFVNAQRNRGIAVTANRLRQLLTQYGTNPLISNFLR